MIKVKAYSLVHNQVTLFEIQICVERSRSRRHTTSGPGQTLGGSNVVKRCACKVKTAMVLFTRPYLKNKMEMYE